MVILWALLAQGTLHGFVTEKASGEPVPFAVVELVDEGRQTRADARGYYVLAGVRPGQHRVAVEGLGFQPDTVTTTVGDEQTVRLDVPLAPAPVALPAIGVHGRGAARPPTADAGPPAVRMTAAAIRELPALAEPDVLRSVQTLPSFASASDFSTALYVRGSAPDQTMISLDGAPLFNPYHLGGVFAAVDPDAVAVVEARPGALPAAAPDRLAGVVQILTREGGRDRVRSHGALGLVSSRASLDGPLPGGGGGYLISVRRTYLDLLTGAARALGAIPESLPYGFTDAHVKLTHDIGLAGTLTGSGYVNREGLRDPDGDGGGESWRWGTYAGSLAYRTPLSPAASLYLSAAGSAFDATLFGWDTRPQADASGPDPAPEGVPVSRSDVRSGTIRADLTAHRRAHTVRLGLQVEAFTADHVVDPRWTALEQVLPELESRSEQQSAALYVEDEWAATDALQFRAGLRVLRVAGRDAVAMPRMGVTYRIGRRLSATLGGGRYTQSVRTLRNEEALLASVLAYDLLAAVPDDAPLPTAEDLVLGLQWGGEATALRVEGYGKRFRDVPLAPIRLDPEDAPVLAVDELRPGTGRVLGLEVLATHAGPLYHATLSYALTAARHTVDGISYTPRYQRRHLLDLTASRRLGDDGRLTIRLATGSGPPASTVIGGLVAYRHDPDTGTLVPIFDVPRLYDSHNAGRLPPYLRLDAGFRKSYEREWFGRTAYVTPFVQVLNVLNSANPLWHEVDVYGGVRQEAGPRLPILPTLGVEWRF